MAELFVIVVVLTQSGPPYIFFVKNSRNCKFYVPKGFFPKEGSRQYYTPNQPDMCNKEKYVLAFVKFVKILEISKDS